MGEAMLAHAILVCKRLVTDITLNILDLVMNTFDVQFHLIGVGRLLRTMRALDWL